MSETSEKKIQELISMAKAVSRNSYSPYSKFPVGAAVLDSRGIISSACNVENASYGLTICAERSAIFRMIAEGGQAIKAIAIFTPTPSPSAPCGACRQVINEFGPRCLVVSVCDGHGELRTTASSLLPNSFGPENLTSGERDG